MNEEKNELRLCKKYAVLRLGSHTPRVLRPPRFLFFEDEENHKNGVSHKTKLLFFFRGNLCSVLHTGKNFLSTVGEKL